MISDERIEDLAHELLHYQEYDAETSGVFDLARAIEREAIAEPVRLMTEWRNANLAHEEAYGLGFSDFESSAERVTAAEVAILDYLDKMK